MMRTLLLGVAFLIVATPALADANSAPHVQRYVSFGFGHSSCASAKSQESDARQWTAGFWSGANFGSAQSVGADSNLDGIMSEINAICDRAPGMHFDFAAMMVYQKHKAEKR